MIRTMTLIECDCCDARIEYGTSNEHMIMHDMKRLGWHVELKCHPNRHYCPACKVPAKLAKAMEAAK